MIETELEALRKNEQWQLVLEAYQDQHEQIKQRDAESDGWLSRVTAVEGVKDKRLPRIHGKLIALDLLTFQLVGRPAGVRYQLTSLGKQLLTRLPSQVEWDDDQVEWDDGDSSRLTQSA